MTTRKPALSPRSEAILAKALGGVADSDRRMNRATPAKRKRLEADARATITRGTKLAAEVRAQCNGLTRAERDAAFARGMTLIYGEDPAVEVVRLRATLTRIADDCEAVARQDGIFGGEKRAWRAIAVIARNALKNPAAK